MPAAAATFPSRIAIESAMRLTVQAQIALDMNDNAKALQLLTAASSAATLGDSSGVEFPSIYYYSPHMALANLAMKTGNATVARTALEAELAASPRSSAATYELSQLQRSSP